MEFGIFKVPEPVNEPVLTYAPGTAQRATLQQKYQELKSQKIDIPLFIGGQEIRSGKIGECRIPHDHQHILATYHKAGPNEVEMAIKSAMSARKTWATTPFQYRAMIFLRAAELMSKKYRDLLNAACMLAQSKTCHQAEIDIVCELVDFFRFNVKYAEQIYQEQPNSSAGVWNWLEYRPLEGFVFAVTPFNFASIAGNLPTAPAIMGNVVLWKPASSSLFSSYYIMKILEEAGLPPGVINMIPGDGGSVGDVVIKDSNLAGVHFTGSTGVFQTMWKQIGNNIEKYRAYPKLVGETGGKDFMMIHSSADVDEVVAAMVRGAFEFQGQKCSAVSRVYIPDSMWPELRKKLVAEVASIKVGDVSDFTNFMGAVIDRKAYESIIKYIKLAKESPQDKCEIIVGGQFDDKKGYFIQPTVIWAKEPHFTTMEEEIFGPVLTVYVYPAAEFVQTLELCNTTSIYSLTGGIFARDFQAIQTAYTVLREASGNFYINDKVTGAVVGQQPFGGARASGTNDKAGSYLNLLRWVSARSIKFMMDPPKSYRYPFLASDQK